MKLYPQLLALLLGSQATIAVADNFNIEDPNLKAAPASIETTIRAEKNPEFDTCHLVGKYIELVSNDAQSGFAVTTADGCGWAAASGPVWVVHVASKGANLVLSSDGYSLTIGKNAQNGLHHLAISAGAAGWYAESHWKFDGTKYRETASYHFDPNDKANCKAHPKICPWAD